MVDPHEVLSLLRRLDEVGARVSHLRTRLADLPVAVERATAELSKRQDVLERLNAERSELNATRLGAERAAEDVGNHLARSRSHMDRVTDLRQAQALEEEIQKLSALMDERETEALEAMERIDELDAAIAAAEKGVADVADRLEQRRAEHRDETPMLEEELNRKLALGDELLPQLPDDDRAAFLRARGSEGKPALVPMRAGGACGRCYVTLPPQRINETVAMKAFHACPSCAAMIDPQVEDEDEDGDEG
jgi:predicted  nucleic acid-binding Zn-ribbon protein